MTGLAWSSRLGEAVRAKLARDSWAPTVHAITPVTDDVLEVVFSGLGGGVRGLRMERKVVEAAAGRWMYSSLDEIAFDVVALGICEPRGVGQFGPPDEAGVRWLSFPEWLEDIAG